MNKFKNHWWTLLSILLIVLSSFPLQTIAENLQTAEESGVNNLRLTALDGSPLPQEIDPKASFLSQFDLTIAENKKQTLDLPAEITTADKKLYQNDAVTVSVKGNQLKVVNDSDQQASIEGISFEFKLADQVRSLSEVQLNFFSSYEFKLNLKQESQTESSKQIKSSGGAATPFAGSDKTSSIDDMKLNNIYLKRDGSQIYIVKDGVKQNPQPTIKVGDGVYFDYTFTVPSSANLKNGDFIYIALKS